MCYIVSGNQLNFNLDYSDEEEDYFDDDIGAYDTTDFTAGNS
jgi:hypothetical protein